MKKLIGFILGILAASYPGSASAQQAPQNQANINRACAEYANTVSHPVEPGSIVAGNVAMQMCLSAGGPDRLAARMATAGRRIAENLQASEREKAIRDSIEIAQDPCLQYLNRPLGATKAYEACEFNKSPAGIGLANLMDRAANGIKRIFSAEASASPASPAVIQAVAPKNSFILK